MDTEKLAAIEQETSSPPTTLHLFRYKGLKRDQLQAKASDTLQLEQNSKRTELSLSKLYTAKDARLGKLSQTGRELSEQLDNTRSYVTCGTVYLKMRDELQELSPQEFMKFFKQCLAINTRLCDVEKARAEKETYQTTLLRSLNMKNSRQAPAAEKSILDKMADNPPSWFTDDKTAWKAFAYLHANFIGYLYDLSLLASRPDSLKWIIEKADTLPAETKKDEFPDWLSPTESGPTKKEVEEELAEDKEQEIKTISALKKIEEQENYLVATSAEKTQKATERLRRLATQVFPSFEDFSDVVLFGKVLEQRSDILPIKSDSIEMALKSYTHPENVLKNQEPIALYLEKKLQEGEIIQSTQDPIDTNFTDLFTGFLESVKDKESSSANQFRDLRETNKKSFSALNYDVKPFLEVLSVDELSFLQELLGEYSGTTTEQFVWDMAGFISSRFKKGEVPHPGALHYLSRFTASFLRNHYKWAYGELEKSLQDNFSKQEELKPEDSLVTTNLEEEIESTTEEIAQGNLAGWHILYTPNRRADPKHLIEIGGKTMEEREQNMQEFITEENISCSIPPSSIINAFEWLITDVPKEVEQVRAGMDVEGVKFKKLKRQKVRFLYQMYPSEKKLIFFLHQKKDDSYKWN